MRQFAESFYKSAAWKHTRDLYSASVGGVCERCKEHGLITAGEIVHHKIPLSPANINDENITLGFGNLKLVCRLCHAAEHKELANKEKNTRRFKIDEYGRVCARDDEPR